jgi:hypothetical protein
MHEIEEKIDINDLQIKEFFISVFPQKQHKIGTLEAFFCSLMCIEEGHPLIRTRRKLEMKETRSAHIKMLLWRCSDGDVVAAV